MISAVIHRRVNRVKYAIPIGAGEAEVDACAPVSTETLWIRFDKEKPDGIPQNAATDM